MAKVQLYQLYDLQAKTTAGPILTERNAAPAIRAFYDLLGRKETTPGQYPEDFELRHVAEQDDDTGVITGLDRPRTVATGVDWTKAQLAEQNA